MRVSRSTVFPLVAAVFAIALLLIARSILVAPSIETLDKQVLNAEQTYSGSWFFPRGGPYVLGFEAKDDASLYVNDALVVRGKGIQKKRIVYPAGTVKVTVKSKGSVRLLWHPPGRRGPLEYVPASSLSPKIQDPSFSSPGTSIIDGWFALSIVLVVVLCIVYLQRARLQWVDRRVLLWTLGLFLLALGVRLYDLNAAGQTWDEDVNWSAGRNYITNLLSLDFSESSWRWNYEHPPVMKYMAGIGAQFSDGYAGARAISAGLGALACMLLFPIGKRLFSFRVGIVAAVFAAFTPHLIAHSKVVGHEAPTMFFWTLAIWLALRAHDEPEKNNPDPFRLHRRMAVLGIVLGLAIFSRYINGLLAPLIGAILLIQAPSDKRKKTLVLGMTLLVAATIVTCFLIWPRMWSQPILHLQESWAKLKKPHGAEPYLGVMTDSPGASYFFVYLWATIPLGLLVFTKLFFLRAIHYRSRSALVVLVWLLIPLIVTFSPVRQDGVRYVMPSLLAMNIMAAAGVDYLICISSRLIPQKWKPTIFPAISGIISVYLVLVCMRIHPFYLDYYAEQVGGPQAVAKAKRFEIAWWGEGMNEALAYLNKHAPPGAKVYKRCFQPGHLAWMRGDLWKSEAKSPKHAEWFLVYQPLLRGCPLPADAQLVFEATANGAPLSRVYKARSDRAILPQ